MCDVGDLPAGTYDVAISTTFGYPAFDEGTNKLVFEYAVCSDRFFKMGGVIFEDIYFNVIFFNLSKLLLDIIDTIICSY